mgnify:CR=1 FL=1
MYMHFELFRYTFQIRVDFYVLMHTSGHQYILFYFLFQIMVNKKNGKQNRKCGIYKRHLFYAQLKFVGLK